MHATGKGSDGEWHRGYTRATLAMAGEMYRKGCIPVFCWHWKDPSHAVEAFYSPATTNNPVVTFDLARAFVDTATFAAFDTASAEYRAILRDIDIIAGHLKTLAAKDVPVLWRPVHEASGRWFWWGYKGPKPRKALWKLMFDRYVNHHKLDNLVWVWTSDEAGDAMDWYPGDDYVDIVGRDFYYYPRIANHGSLVASFEKIKDIFGGRKLIALSENGSVPHPDSMQADGAAWSWFMPWYGDYTMDSWANDNTKADWRPARPGAPPWWISSIRAEPGSQSCGMGARRGLASCGSACRICRPSDPCGEAGRQVRQMHHCHRAPRRG